MCRFALSQDVVHQEPAARVHAAIEAELSAKLLPGRRNAWPRMPMTSRHCTGSCVLNRMFGVRSSTYLLSQESSKVTDANPNQLTVLKYFLDYDLHTGASNHPYPLNPPARVASPVCSSQGLCAQYRPCSQSGPRKRPAGSARQCVPPVSNMTLLTRPDATAETDQRSFRGHQ